MPLKAQLGDEQLQLSNVKHESPLAAARLLPTSVGSYLDARSVIASRTKESSSQKQLDAGNCQSAVGNSQKRLGCSSARLPNESLLQFLSLRFFSWLLLQQLGEEDLGRKSSHAVVKDFPVTDSTLVSGTGEFPLPLAGQPGRERCGNGLPAESTDLVNAAESIDCLAPAALGRQIGIGS
ncbi:hypothetical protein NE237_029592 [Protea cynaroides]|uniref:Uncharacterized protein n=1 Tax=Protea cynaroides TaxID=273540 RepID=A0A9Q0JW80_9MAGN|nr:hypothetical protein NE237_029592 [Protea cynaroides]